MGSICPRSFLFVIIQGINLVYSPREPVAVALALPAKSLDTQSVSTKQQLGLSHSCQLNRGAGWILAGFAAYIWCIWPSVTSESSSCFLFVRLFLSVWRVYLFTASTEEQTHRLKLVTKVQFSRPFSDPSDAAERSEVHNTWFITYTRTSKWWIVARCSRPIYSWYLDLW